LPVSSTGDAAYGGVVNVTVELPANYTETSVVFYVDGVEYQGTVDINDTLGTAMISVSGLDAGNHTVTVVYNEDEFYGRNENSTSFKITKATPTIKVDVKDDVDVGSDVFINVTVPDDATGFVNIIVDGKDHYVPINDGNANYTIENVQPGKHNITVVYDGDENYAGASENDSFVAGTYPVTLDVDTVIDENNNVTVIVRVPADAEGVVNVTIGNTTYNATVKDGVAEVNIGVQPKGTHEINVTYSGDSKYSPADNITNITVRGLANYTLPVSSTGDAAYGGVVNVTVELPANYTETSLVFYVDGTPYTGTVNINDTLGTAMISVSGLDAGNHTVTVVYNEDEFYGYNENSTSFEITKAAPSIVVDVDDNVEAGDDVFINVTVPDDATGFVNIIVDGKDHFVPIKDGNANYTFENAQPGKHNITVVYDGDENYAGASENDSFVAGTYPVTLDVDAVSDENNNVTVIVRVPADAEGVVNVTIGNTTYNATVENGVAKVNVGVQPKGTHEINVTYSGDSKYSTANNVTNITVGGLANYTLPMESEDINYGDVAKVNVTLPDGANSSNVKFYVDGVENTNFNVTGNVVTLTLNDLDAGDHTVSVVYTEDGTFAGKENSTTFNVASVDPSMNVDVKPIDVGQVAKINVTLPEDASGTITVNVNGTKYVADVINGSAIVSIPNLGNGVHELNITYSGDGNYNTISTVENLTVSKVTPTIEANTTNITLGESALINVTIPDDATGTVTIKIGDIEQTSPVIGGRNSISVPGIPVGTHEVIVTYNGNDKYTNATAQTTIKVNASKTKEEDIKVEDLGNGTIIVTVPEGATGNVTIELGNETYTAEVIDGKAVFDIANETNQTPGVHDINVTYSGDENHTGITVNATATVPKWDAAVSVTIPTIREGDVATIIVEVTPLEGDGITATGQVLVNVNGTGYYADLDDGKAIVNVPGLGKGTYDVKVSYKGDEIYNENTTKGTLEVESGIAVEVNGTGNNSQVIIHTPGNGTGSVDVLIDNKPVESTLDENGTVKVNLTGLTPGKHNLTVIYTDENGTQSIVNTTIIVPPWDSSVDAVAPTVREGDNAIVTVTVGDVNMTGGVVVDVNGTKYYSEVTDGVVNVTVPGLKAGEYPIVVTYQGNEIYNPSNATLSITVEDPITVEVNGTGNSSQVIIHTPGNGTGSVDVLIDNKPVESTLDENGTVKVNLTGLTPGRHNLTVIYTDANGTQSIVNTTIIVPPWDSSVDAVAPTIREGDNAIVTVTVGDVNMTGGVVVDVNGTKYYSEVTDGVVNVTVPGLKAGEYPIVVTYQGNEIYNPSNATLSITVEDPITVEVNGTGNSSQVIIQIPGNGTGSVDVLIDNKPVESTFDENGTVKVNLTGLEPGEHNLTVIYTDANGTQSIVNTKIIVPPWDSSVNASAKTIREGDDAVIIVTVGSSDMTGMVLVDLNGTGYYGDLIDGKAVIVAPGIKEGIHNANVTYLGSEKYLPSNNTFVLVVQAPITIDVDGAGNSTKVIIGLPEDDDGSNVTLLVDGKEVPLTVSNGTAVATLDNITAGEHNVTVIYTDSNGTKSVVNATITVYNSIKANDMTRGWNSPFDYEAEFLDKDGHVIANTTMEFKVNGQTYSVITDNKGIAKLNESHLAIGTYEVEITNTLTHEVLKHNVTIVKRLIENKDIEMDFVDGTYYVVRAIGDDGQPVGKGEVVGITVNERGYVAITDANGYARLKIELNPRAYVIVAEYSKYNVTNKLLVKQTFKLVKKTVKVKKTAKKLVLKAKLKWSNGKAIKGKQITFKFKGKKYTAKTDSKGIAKVTLKKKVVKKLKKGKEYNYSATYISNILKGKVKVKK
jgi:hypothetical protein